MKTTTTTESHKRSERGAALVVMLALMTLMTLALLAVAPSIQQQVQRQREEEAIRRGEEVAEAIKQYVAFHNGTKLPTEATNWVR